MMKKRMMNFAVGTLAGLMMFGASVSVFAAGVTVDDAKKTALESVGLTEDKVIFKQTVEDNDDGRQIYEIDFVVPGQVKYDFDIDQNTGAILEQDVELWEADDDAEYASLIQAAKGGLSDSTAAAVNGEITDLQAKTIAMKDCGYNADQITFTKCERDMDDGVVKFDVELRISDGTEVDYEINAADGKILEKDVDRFDD